MTHSYKRRNGQEIIYLSCAETAKLVREALKDKFPDVKFSVVSHTYSGGASIRVEWVEGPTGKQVESVAKRYEGADFDGMIDLKTHHDTIVDGKHYQMGADWVFCTRYTQAEADEHKRWEAEWAAKKEAHKARRLTA